MLRGGGSIGMGGSSMHTETSNYGVASSGGQVLGAGDDSVVSASLSVPSSTPVTDTRVSSQVRGVGGEGRGGVEKIRKISRTTICSVFVPRYCCAVLYSITIPPPCKVCCCTEVDVGELQNCTLIGWLVGWLVGWLGWLGWWQRRQGEKKRDEKVYCEKLLLLASLIMDS